nr:hypothetical protein BaRGS_005697 [Batillaria attramentaria]
MPCPQQDDELLCDVTCPEGCRCQENFNVKNCHAPADTIAVFVKISYDPTSLGQLFIYKSVRENSFMSDKPTANDATIARRLTTVVLSDFLCWFPIGLLGVLASTGTAVSSEVNVAMVIFVRRQFRAEPVSLQPSTLYIENGESV